MGTHEEWAAPRLHDEEGDNTANTRGVGGPHEHTKVAWSGFVDRVF